jgi:tRNA nucleotidyltransferase (CCA-adding enzyme)
VEFGASLEEDLARRDFTINAIAYSPRRREIRDPFDGRGDLERRVVRAVGEPDARMREDRLRALRAIRFSARFGFTIEPATLRAIVESAPHLGRLSPERVKQELEKTLEQAPRPTRALALWKSTGALATLIPSLGGIDDVAIAALDCLAAPGPRARPQRRLARVAMLFVGLPAETVQRALEDLRFSRHDTKWIVNLAMRWASMNGAIAEALITDVSVPDISVRRWVAAIGRLEIGAFMRVASARWSAARAGGGDVPTSRNVRALYRRMLRCAFRSGDPLELRDLAVDGDDLRREGIPPGPWTGKILQSLLAMVLDDPALNVPDVLLREAKRLYEAFRDRNDEAGNGGE